MLSSCMNQEYRRTFRRLRDLHGSTLATTKKASRWYLEMDGIRYCPLCSRHYPQRYEPKIQRAGLCRLPQYTWRPNRVYQYSILYPCSGYGLCRLLYLAVASRRSFGMRKHLIGKQYTHFSHSCIDFLCFSSVLS
jgi:hypothetical protein